MNGSVRTSVVLASLLASAVFAPSLAFAADSTASPAGTAAATTAAPASPTNPATHAAVSPTAATPAPDASSAKPTVAAPTHAQAASAKKHLAAAGKLYKSGDATGALAEYQAADADDANAESARGIGQSQEKLGHIQEAVQAYERYLALEAAMPKHSKGTDADVDATKASVDTLKKTPGKVHVDTDPAGAEVHVDGLDTAYKGPFDLDLAPGTHTLHATAEGKSPADQSVDVPFGAPITTKITLQPLPIPPPTPVVVPPVSPIQPSPGTPPPPAPESRSLIPAYATGGLAIGAAVVGTVFGIIALSNKSDYDDHPTASKADTGESHALVSDMAFGIALSLGVTSAILFLSHDDAPVSAKSGDPATTRAIATRAASKPKFDLAPVVTPHGGGAGALLRF